MTTKTTSSGTERRSERRDPSRGFYIVPDAEDPHTEVVTKLRSELRSELKT